MKQYSYAIVHSGSSIHDNYDSKNTFNDFQEMWEKGVLNSICVIPGVVNKRSDKDVITLLTYYSDKPHCVMTIAYNPSINNDWVNSISIWAVYVWSSEKEGE